MTALTAGELSGNYTGRFSGAIHQPLAKVSDEYKGMLGILHDESINPTTIQVKETSLCGSQVCFDITIRASEDSTPKVYYWTATAIDTDYANAYDKAEIPMQTLLANQSNIISRCLYFNSTDKYVRARVDFDVYSNINITTLDKNFTCSVVNLGGIFEVGQGGASLKDNCGLTLYAQKMTITNRQIRYAVLDINQRNVESKVEDTIFLRSNGDYIKSKIPLLFSTSIPVEAQKGSCKTVLKIPVDRWSVIFTWVFVFLVFGALIVLIAKRKRG
jgi:hypothetical protein